MNSIALRQIRQPRPATVWGRIRDFLRAPVVYEVAEDYDAWAHGVGMVRLPAGFRSDLASTPRFVWALGLRPDAPGVLMPSLLHDFYYRHGYLLSPGGGQYRGTGKAWADRMFARLVKFETGLAVPAATVYAALVCFGWPAWKANARYREGSGAEALQGDFRD